MAVSALSPLSLTPIFNNDGRLVRTASLYVYRPDTLDPVTVYRDQELGAPHPQPIVTGGSGRVPPIYVGPEPYRVRIFDESNSLVEDIGYIPGATESTGGPGGGGDTAVETGDVIWRFSNGGVRQGWVRLNGGFIGNPSLSEQGLPAHIERANDDAHDLFIWLWGQSDLTEVFPSRGQSAEGDWLASKGVRLPDARNRVLAGIADMTGVQPDVASRRLTGATFDTGDPNTVGATGGRATGTLTQAQLPAYNLTVTDPGHAHGASQAAHNHGVNDPGHGHGVTQTPHVHGVSDPGHGHGVAQSPHAHGVTDPGHAHNYWQAQVGSSAVGSGIGAGNLPTYSTVATEGSGTGIGIQAQYANISINGAYTGVWINGGNANISVNNSATGVTLQNAQPAVTVNPAATGIAVASAGGGQAHNISQPFLLGCYFMKL